MTTEKSATAAALPVSKPPDSYLSGAKLGIVILSLFLGVFVISLDSSIIGVVIPSISSEFQALDDVAWYGTAYLLTITAFQPLYGSMYKFFQVEWVFRACLVVFEVGSILCAAATSSPMFIVGRAVAGTGAAGILQGALSIIAMTVVMEKRPLYQGIVISVYVISVCIGPVIGGAFTTRGIWRWCFWINVPIGAMTLLLLLLALRIRGTKNANRTLPLKQKLAHMDPLGCIVFMGAICCLLLALQWGGQTKPWHSATIIGLFIGFGLLAIVFAVIQFWRKERALIPLRVLRQRSIWAGGGVLFCLGAATYAVSYYMPFYFQAVLGTNAVHSGVDLISVFIPEMIALIITGGIVMQWGYYVCYMVLGELICMAGTILLTKMHIGSSTVFWAAGLAVHGIGMGTAMQLPYTAVNVVLHDDDIPTGNAIAVFVWQLGGALAIAIGQAIALNNILHEVPREIPQLSPERVMSWGASNLAALAPSADALVKLRSIWCTSVAHIMIFALACVCLSIPFTVSMEWLNAKKAAEEKKKQAGEVAALVDGVSEYPNKGSVVQTTQ
ncbi:permease of the major facilitator superfamily [Aspergillus ellipticus CBS 707.79]|uniref:Permease of the major facilitator superfamily n=1 Tax=Aspergillus ellipticus CBS 707.79 TaxID=1448320 RepID=A0A319DKN4_9EURO|nr:permease of the major facilitator superfamily [Aspergillus ellipticus CBS 707.79]